MISCVSVVCHVCSLHVPRACACVNECQRAYVIDGSGKEIIVLLYYTCTDTILWFLLSKFFFIIPATHKEVK